MAWMPVTAILLSMTFINRFLKSIHPAEITVSPYYSAMLYNLIVYEVESTFEMILETNFSDIIQKNS